MPSSIPDRSPRAAAAHADDRDTRPRWHMAIAVAGIAVAAAALGGVVVASLPAAGPEPAMTADQPVADAAPQDMNAGAPSTAKIDPVPADGKSERIAAVPKPAAAAEPLPSPATPSPAAQESVPPPAAENDPQRQIQIAHEAPQDVTPQAPASGAATVNPLDALGTGSIAGGHPPGNKDVDVAASEADVARLEETTGMVAPETPDPTASGKQAAAIPAGNLAAASTNRYVNLRAGPADEASVLLVVPANAAIQAETDCGWCLVQYKGSRGYIYKSFIRRTPREELKGAGLY